MTVIVTKMPGGVTQLFNTETGHLTSLESCDVIKGDQGYKEALSVIIEAKKEFAKNKDETTQKEIPELENKLSSL